MSEVFGVRPGSYWKARRSLERPAIRRKRDGKMVEVSPKLFWRQDDCMRVESITQNSPTGASLQIVMEEPRRGYKISYYQLRYYFERDFSRGI